MKSLAYRNNKEDIIEGKIPEKYSRLLPYVHGDNILEIGSAEGVLSLLLAKHTNLQSCINWDTTLSVLGIEKNKERFEEALRLKEIWKINNCNFLNCDITNRLDLLEDIDTLVAVRTIYYFRENLNKIFTNISKRCKTVVLSGNAGRSLSYKEGNLEKDVGDFNYYATSEGMIELLEKYGYVIGDMIKESYKVDPIVVGHKLKQQVVYKLDYRIRESLGHHLIRKGLIEHPNQIRTSIVGEEDIDTNLVFEKSSSVLNRCHVQILKDHELYGKNFDYTKTEYWKWLTSNRGKRVTKRGDPIDFINLYNRIKVEGFKADKRNPVIIGDITNFNLEWKLHRANGSHRVSIAKAMGLKKIPVLIVNIDIIPFNKLEDWQT